MIEIIEKYNATDLLHRADRLSRHAEGDGRGADSPRCAPRYRPARPAGAGLRGVAGKTGKPILDGIGSTEMLHIFISNRFGDEARRPPREAGKAATKQRSSTRR